MAVCLQIKFCENNDHIFNFAKSNIPCNLWLASVDNGKGLYNRKVNNNIMTETLL